MMQKCNDYVLHHVPLLLEKMKVRWPEVHQVAYNLLMPSLTVDELANSDDYCQVLFKIQEGSKPGARDIETKVNMLTECYDDALIQMVKKNKMGFYIPFEKMDLAMREARDKRYPGKEPMDLLISNITAPGFR